MHHPPDPTGLPPAPAESQALVSVIVRSMGRAELAEALASIAAQSWPAIEVVVVDAAGGGRPELPQRCGPFPLRVVTKGAQLPRPAAANAGLDAANGELVMFLDEDDWIAPGHIAALAGLLAGHSAAAAYAGIQAVTLEGYVRADLPVFNAPFDPVRLMWNNFMPIHAVLFRRALVTAGCRFDESLEVYEDWDFWLQVAARTRFLHRPEVSGFYRAAGESGAGGVGHDSIRGHAGRIRLFDKWRRLWSAEQLHQLFEFLDAGARLEELHGRVARLEHELALRHQNMNALEQRALALEQRAVATEQRAALLEHHAATLEQRAVEQAQTIQARIAEVRAGERELDQLHGRFLAAEEHARQLKRILDDMRASSSWRLTRPLRAGVALARRLRNREPDRIEQGPLVWRLELFVLQDGPFGGPRVILLSGWALDRESGRAPRLKLRANGATLLDIECLRERDDVRREFGPKAMRPPVDNLFGFEATLYVDHDVGRVLLESESGIVLGDARYSGMRLPRHLPLLPRPLGQLVRHGARIAGIARRRVGWRGLLAPQRWHYYWLKARQELQRLRHEERAHPQVQALDAYRLHFANNRLREPIIALLSQAVGRFALRPTFSIVMPVYNVEARWLTRAVESVRAQIWPHWQLCIADDASTRAETRACLDRITGDPRITVLRREENGHICRASNSAAALATGEFLLLLDQDDELEPHALFEIARRIQREPQADLIYSDEDKLDLAGNPYDPHFKPDFSPTLLLGYNYINHLTCIRRSLFEDLGGFRPGFEGAQDYDLLLRAVERTARVQHIAKVLHHWRAIPESTASAAQVKPIVESSAQRALEEHLTRRGIALTAYRPEFAARRGLPIFQLDGPDSGPRVTLIIPARNQYEVTARCVESIRARTSYRDYTLLLVDNGSDDPRAIEWYRAEQARGTEVLRIESPGGRFSFSAVMNEAVSAARGEFVLLLNNDTEVIDPRWLSRMIGYAGLPGVGAVGARLLYPNGNIQHAGVVLGLGKDRAPGHAFYRHDGAALSCFFQAETAREVSAVTGACLLTPRALYLDAGGFDAEHLPISLNDVDYCLRLGERGLRTLYVGGAELVHHESLSRSAEDDPVELGWFKQRHGDARERYYNPNLSRDGGYRPLPDTNLDYLEFSERPLKVLFYSHNLNHEGAPKVVMAVATALKNSGRFEPMFLAPSDGPGRALLEEAGIPCTVLPPQGSENILQGWADVADFRASVAAVARAVEASGADLVVANVLNSFFVVNAAAALGIPSVFVIHESYDRARMYGHLPGFAIEECERAFEQASRVVFVSEETRALYARYDRLRNATVIYNGLEPALIERARAADRERARTALGIAPGTKLLLTVGTVCDRKDQETLVRACGLLARRRDDFVCHLVGARQGTPYYEYLRGIIGRLKLDAHVVLVEETPEVERYYAAADLFVFTSLNESYSLTVIEAMAYGLPIVTTPVCGVGEQVRFHINAEAVPFREPPLLARTLAELLDDPARRAAMGRASRAMLEYMPNHAQMIDAYARLLAGAWARGAQGPV